VLSDRPGPARADLARGVPGDLQRQQQMGLDVAAGRLQVEGGQGRVVGAGAGDQQVVYRGSQGVEEPLEPVEVGGVEGGDAGPELQADTVQAVGVAGGEDHLGALGAGEPGRLQPDARAAPDHENGLTEQVPLSPPGRRGGRGGHVVGAHAASLSWVTASASRRHGGVAPGRHPGRSLVCAYRRPRSQM
jgi:hypothetical protein